MQAALLCIDPLPLVVMTPKSLLRHPLARSSPRELAAGQFERVLEEADDARPAADVRRMILCSGKVYVDLITSEHRSDARDVVLVRLEQLYPFPDLELRPVFERYPGLEHLFWVQEEPENMGAWEYVRPRLAKLIDARWPLTYIGRPRNASPAEGSLTRHSANQMALVKQAFAPEAQVDEADVLVSKANGTD